MPKSPVNAYVRLNRWMWKHVPASLTRLPAVRSYGALLHRVVRARAARRQYFGTAFFRNRPQLMLMRRLADDWGIGSTVRMAFLGCSNGAEVYSILWTVRSARPDVTVMAHAVDISPEVLQLAQNGVYSLTAPALVEAPVFDRIAPEEVRQMFDIDAEREEVTVKSWLRQGITWHLGDAGSPEIRDALGPQDMVVANNFLCHMPPRQAQACLRSIARLLRPGGYIFVSGMDLDVRTRVARDLRWRPVPELIEDIHDGDPALRNDWPCEYWGLEPLDKRRRDWRIRYASAFQSRA